MCQVIIEKNLSQNNKKYRGITKMNKTRREKRERGGKRAKNCNIYVINYKKLHILFLRKEAQENLCRERMICF